MPLTTKGKKILAAMKAEYGSSKKGESVFYASAKAGVITGVHRGRHKSLATRARAG